MRTPAPRELLDAWDAGWAMPPAERLQPLLHAAAEPAAGEPADRDSADRDSAALSVGERDRLLVALRERLFGTTLHARTGCPSCGEVLELSLATTDLLAADGPPEEIVVRSDGLVVRCRPLRPADLAEAATAASPDAARTLLISRAVLAIDQPMAVDELPVGVVSVVAAALAEADPLSDVELPVRCEACGAEWTSPFDIVSYLWQEIDSWARRLLAEVHTLARAYGWSEQQVLSMSPHRRHRYLELVADG